MTARPELPAVTSRDVTLGVPVPEPLAPLAVPDPAALRVGRPRHWTAPAEKHRAFRQRQAEQRELLADLLLALRNARLEQEGDPELRRAALEGNDIDLLRSLVRHYQTRHWRHGKKEADR